MLWIGTTKSSIKNYLHWIDALTIVHVHSSCISGVWTCHSVVAVIDSLALTRAT
jgi:hypothetical protein